MEFDPDLTRRVRDFILARGSAPEATHPSDHGSADEGESLEQRALMRRVAPMAEALFLVMSADGICHDEERRALRGAMRTITDCELADASFERLFATFARALSEEGLEARLGAAAAQLSVARIDTQVALELAAAVITADGDLDPRERAALEQLAEEAGADPDRVLGLLD